MTKYLRHVFTFKNPTVNYSQQVNFGKISERFKNSIISQKEDNIFELIVKKRITHPIDISKNEARIEAASLLDRLSLMPNHIISDLKYIGYFTDTDEFFNEKVNYHLKTTASALLTDPETYYLKEDVKLILTQKLPEDLLRMFRIGKALEDKKTQFIFLYGILYLLNNDKQKAVDNYIKEQIPDILIIQGYIIDETIVTNLRNRIAHPKRESNIQELEELVNQYVPTLLTLIEKKLM